MTPAVPEAPATSPATNEGPAPSPAPPPATTPETPTPADVEAPTTSTAAKSPMPAAKEAPAPPKSPTPADGDSLDPEGNDGMDIDSKVLPHFRYNGSGWELCTDSAIGVGDDRIIRAGDRFWIKLDDYFVGPAVYYTPAMVTVIKEHEFLHGAPPFEYALLSKESESATVFVPAAAAGDTPQVQATGRGTKSVMDAMLKAQVDQNTLIKLSADDEKGSPLEQFVFVPDTHPSDISPLKGANPPPIVSSHASPEQVCNTVHKEALKRTDHFLEERRIEGQARALLSKRRKDCAKKSQPAKEGKKLKEQERARNYREKKKYEGQIKMLNQNWGGEECSAHQALYWDGTYNNGTWQQFTILSHPGNIALFQRNGRGRKSQVVNDAVIGQDNSGMYIVVPQSRIRLDPPRECRIVNLTVQKVGTFAQQLTGNVDGSFRVRWSNGEETWEHHSRVHDVLQDGPRKTSAPNYYDPQGPPNELSSDLSGHQCQGPKDNLPRVTDETGEKMLNTLFHTAVEVLEKDSEVTPTVGVNDALVQCKRSVKGSVKGGTSAEARRWKDSNTTDALAKLAEMSLTYSIIRDLPPEEEVIVDGHRESTEERGRGRFPGRLPALEEMLGPKNVQAQGYIQAIQLFHEGRGRRQPSASSKKSRGGNAERKGSSSRGARTRSSGGTDDWWLEARKTERGSGEAKAGISSATSTGAKRVKLDGGRGNARLCAWAGCLVPAHSSSKGHYCRNHSKQAGEEVKICKKCNKNQSRRKGGMCFTCFKEDNPSLTKTFCQPCSLYGRKIPAREHGGLCTTCSANPKTWAKYVMCCRCKKQPRRAKGGLCGPCSKESSMSL
jgi:hypothetical protein